MNMNTLLLKNMIDMGVVNRNDHTTAQCTFFRSDLTLRLERKKRIFATETSDSNYICKISGVNNLGDTLFEIITNEIQIMILVDNLYQFIEYHLDSIYQYFNPSSVNTPPKVFGFFCNNNYSIEREFCIYDFIDERLHRRFRFDVNIEELTKFIDILIEVFLIDIPVSSDNNQIE